MDRTAPGEEAIDGYFFVGEHRALDLVNTEAMIGGERRDLLDSPGSLTDWLGQSGELEKVEAERLQRRWVAHPAEGEVALRAVREARARLRRFAEELADQGRPSEASLEELNAALASRPGRREVVWTEAGGEVRFMPEPGSEIEARLLELTLAFLSRSDGFPVKRCGNPRCILFFLDTTKNRRRRWCSMAGCGNRAKASSYYRRRTESARAN